MPIWYHLHRWRQRWIALSRLPHWTARHPMWLSRNLLFVAQGRIAKRYTKAWFHQACYQSHHGQRADAIFLAWFPPWRAPHGRYDWLGRRLIGLLPRQHWHQQPRAPRYFCHPFDCKNAYLGRHGLQIHHWPALYVSQERPELCRQLLAHDVRHALRRLCGQPSTWARLGSHLYLACRPWTKRVDLYRAFVRLFWHQPLCSDCCGCGLLVGPCPRWCQRSVFEHASRHPENGWRCQSGRVHGESQR